MNETKRAYLQLHFAILLFGITAILGALIQLPALVLVWWRVLITSISLIFLIQFGRKLHLIPKKIIFRFMGIGVLVALHWFCFFAAIQYANASICLVCMATASFFTSFLEPIILGHRIKWFEIVLGLLIVPGMILVVNSTELSMMTGIWLGLTSAFLAALFTIFNKRYIDQAEPMSITFLELGTAWLFISLILPFYFYKNPELSFWPSWADFAYLLILALACTTLAYVLALHALKYISAFASNLAVNLEPVYGILLAAVILKEHQQLNSNFYMGAGVIIFSVLIYPYLKRRLEGRMIDVG